MKRYSLIALFILSTTANANFATHISETFTLDSRVPDIIINTLNHPALENDTGADRSEILQLDTRVPNIITNPLPDIISESQFGSFQSDTFTLDTRVPNIIIDQFPGSPLGVGTGQFQSSLFVLDTRIPAITIKQLPATLIENDTGSFQLSLPILDTKIPAHIIDPLPVLALENNKGIYQSFLFLLDTRIPNSIAPTASADTFTVFSNTVANPLNVLTNDSFAPDTGETLSIAFVNLGNQGAVISTDGNQIFYSPKLDFVGNEIFTYILSDGKPASYDNGIVTVKVNPPPPSALDIDDDGIADALSDGVMILRFIQSVGSSQTGLSASVVGVDCDRCEEINLKNFISSAYQEGKYDVDGDSVIDSDDGTLILRFLFGVKEQSLIDGLDLTGCVRCDPTVIQNHLIDMLP